MNEALTMNKSLFRMNRNQIKYLVIIFMIFSHMDFLYTDGSFLYFFSRFLSRTTAPAMAYFLVDGYFYTRDVKKYLSRLAIFSLISWPIFTYFETGSFRLIYLAEGLVDDQPALFLKNMGTSLVISRASVISTLVFCLLAVIIMDSKKLNNGVKAVLVLLCMWLAELTDWGWLLVAFCVVFYVFRNDHRLMWAVYAVVSLMYCMRMYPDNLFLMNFSLGFRAYRLGTLLVIPLLEFVFNGQPGRKSKFNKYFFYVFYPLHLLLLGLIKWCA